MTDAADIEEAPHRSEHHDEAAERWAGHDDA